MASIKIPNPPENLTPTYFWRTSAARTGLAKSARYILRIIPSSGRLLRTINSVGTGTFRDLTYLCESLELPSRAFLGADLRYYGPNFKIPYQTVYEDLNASFLCRDEFKEREMFDTWMELINPQNRYDFNYRDDYVCKIEVFQMSEVPIERGSSDPKAQYKFTFDKAYPIILNPQPATWADDNYHRLTISFTYVRWYREQLDSRIEPRSYDLVSGKKNIREGGTTISDMFETDAYVPPATGASGGGAGGGGGGGF